VNTQHLEPQNEPEAEKYRPVPAVPEVTTEAVTAPPPATEAEIQEVLRKLQTRRPGRRLRARVHGLFSSGRTQVQDPAELLQMDLDSVLGILREENLSRAKRQKFFIGIFVSIVVLFILVAITTRNLHLFGTLGSYVGLLTAGAVASQQQKSAAAVIARFDDVRAIGPLAEALEFKDKNMQSLVEQALIRLVPRLKASDSSLLSPDQRACLNRALKGKNTELILAILKAWEQVGDSGAIAEVEKLAEGHGQGEKSARIREAAQECLPALRQSAERQHLGAQLLRASAAVQASPDTLLRPAMPHLSTDPPDQLLRPGDSTS
jgi:hypothetical protein